MLLVVASVISRVADNKTVMSRQVLSRVASEMAKTLPIMVNEELELFSVVGHEGVIAYGARYINLQDTVELRSLFDAYSPKVIKRVCTTPGSRDKFLKNVPFRLKSLPEFWMAKPCVSPDKANPATVADHVAISIAM